MARADPTLVIFLADSDDAEQAAILLAELRASDVDMVRMLEDLIRALIDKRVLLVTDLPDSACKKLLERGDIRTRLQRLGGLAGG